MHAIDPVFAFVSVVYLKVVVGLSRSPRESVWSMEHAGNMHKFEMESEDSEDPAIHAGRGVDIRVGEHTMNCRCVDFDDEIANADEVDFESVKSAIETIQFEFGLRKPCLSIVEGDGAEASEVAFSSVVGVALGENETDGNVRCVNG